MLGVEIPAGAEHEEPEADGHDGETLMRAKGGRGGKKTKDTTAKPIPPEFKEKFANAAGGWGTAIADVGGQVDDLAKELAKSPDEEIRDIGKHALPGIVGGYKALLDGYVKALGDGSDEAAVHKDGPKLLGAVADLRTTIEKDRQVAVMDDNPFNCLVTIKGTLGPALSELEAALRLGLG